MLKADVHWESGSKKRLHPPLFSLAPYDLHKRLVNNYLLSQKGATVQLQRDTSRDKRDIDVVREHHKFLWEATDVPDSWEERLAKKYYDKLFKEFCVCDLSRYKENKVAMRWRTEPELVIGKGQFICGDKNCADEEDLRTWEVNFAYLEHGKKNNALVKARLCPSCSEKLNHHHAKREVVSTKKKKQSKVGEKSKKRKTEADEEQVEAVATETEGNADKREEEDANAWRAGSATDEVSREEEFQDYLEELLF